MDKTAFNQAYIAGILKVAYSMGADEQDILRIATAAGIEKEANPAMLARAAWSAGRGALTRGAQAVGRFFRGAPKVAPNPLARPISTPPPIINMTPKPGGGFQPKGPGMFSRAGQAMMNNPKKTIAAGGFAAGMGVGNATASAPQPQQQQYGYPSSNRFSDQVNPDALRRFGSGRLAMHG